MGSARLMPQMRNVHILTLLIGKVCLMMLIGDVCHQAADQTGQPRAEMWMSILCGWWQNYVQFCFWQMSVSSCMASLPVSGCYKKCVCLINLMWNVCQLLRVGISLSFCRFKCLFCSMVDVSVSLADEKCLSRAVNGKYLSYSANWKGLSLAAGGNCSVPCCLRHMSIPDR
jgi:hypothetical protein